MSKYQEALNALCDEDEMYKLAKGFSFDDDYTSEHDYDKAEEHCKNVIQELIYRATPKEPIERHYEEDGEQPYIKTTCPNGCHITLSKKYDKFCPECGQAIDWSGENE